jgi:hypothetical protein
MCATLVWPQLAFLVAELDFRDLGTLVELELVVRRVVTLPSLGIYWLSTMERNKKNVEIRELMKLVFFLKVNFS